MTNFPSNFASQATANSIGILQLILSKSRLLEISCETCRSKSHIFM